MPARPAILAIAALGAAAGVVWLLASSGIFAPKPDGSGERAGRPDEGPEPAAPSDDGDAAATLSGGGKREEGKGSVVARVLLGADHSGVAGVRVSLSGTSARKGLVSRMTTTDAAGRAVLGDVSEGNAYLVRIEPPDEPVVERAGVVVRAGEETVLGDVFIAAHGEVSGRVLDEDRKPIEKATVVATVDATTLAGVEEDPWPASPAVAGAIAVAATDKDGAFHLERLPSGIVAMRAVADGYRPAVDRASIPAGPLWKADPVVFVLKKARAVAGIVIDGDGKGIPGAKVSLGSPQGRGDVSPILSTETGPDGTFRVDGFHPGFSRGDLEAAGKPDFPIRYRVSALGLPTIVQDVQGLHDDLRFVLTSAAVVHVVVTDTFAKQPVEGALLVLGIRDAQNRVTLSTIATTDRGGKASLAVDVGTIDFLSFRHPHFRSADLVPRLSAAFLRRTPMSWEGDLSKPIGRGETREISLHPWRGFALYGRVSDPKGAAIPAASLRVVYADGTPGLSGRPDEKGEYRIDGVVGEHGPYADASAPGWVLPRERHGIDFANAESGNVRKDATLFPAVTVRGRVVDAAGSGIGAARVGAEARPVRTKPDGTYVLTQVDGNPKGGLAPPRLQTTVGVVADGYLPGESAPFWIQSGTVVDAPDVVLSRGDAVGEAILGRVLGVDAGPLPLAVVETFRVSTAPRSTCSGPDGRFALRALPPGQYQLRASAPGLLGWSERLVLDPAALPLSVDIPTYAWTTVSGRVLKADGTPVPHATVRVEQQGFTALAMSLGVENPVGDTDEQGAYSFRALTDGALTLVAGSAGYATKRQPVRATGANDVTLEPARR